MAWDTSAPSFEKPPAPGWGSAPESVPPTYSQGWHVVLGFEGALSVHCVTEAELRALLNLDLVLAVEPTMDLALRAIKMLSTNWYFGLNRSADINIITSLDAALAATVERGLEFARITGVDLTLVLGANRESVFTKIAPLDGVASLAVNRSASLTSVAPLSGAALITANRSATFGILSNLDAAAPVTVSRSLEQIRITGIANAAVFNADRACGIGFPPFTSALTSITTVGAYSYSVPRNSQFIDIILLGGGGGGRGMPNFGTWGQGGRAGSWVVVTLQRGVGLPYAVTAITGVIGDGGAGSAAGFAPSNGSPGQATTATASGMTSLSAAGGIGGQGGLIDPGGQAVDPSTQSLNGQTYTGGGLASGGGSANVPGGGGPAAIVTFQAGAKGGRGQAWFYAYQ